jgi:FkbM family methyltransferase
MIDLRSMIVRLAGWTPMAVRTGIYKRQWLLSPLARCLKTLIPVDKEVVVTLTDGPNAGLKLTVDRGVPNYFWLNSHYESAMERAFAETLHAGMVVADIGAHMGFDTMFMARTVGGAGRVLSFEPDPENVRRLSRNCSLNGFANVNIYPVAVAASNGVARFAATGGTTSRFARTDEIDSIEIRTVTLDEIVFGPSTPQLDLVKMDVEGAEQAVLEGASRTLLELRPIWLIECHSAALLSACARILQGANYRIGALTQNPFYRRAIEDLTAGREMSSAGFDVGHIRATPSCLPSPH